MAEMTALTLQAVPVSLLTTVLSLPVMLAMTITATAAITFATAGGGQGADITFGNGGTTSNVRGGMGKDSITLVGAFTGSTFW